MPSSVSQHQGSSLAIDIITKSAQQVLTASQPHCVCARACGCVCVITMGYATVLHDNIGLHVAANERRRLEGAGGADQTEWYGQWSGHDQVIGLPVPLQSCCCCCRLHTVPLCFASLCLQCPHSSPSIYLSTSLSLSPGQQMETMAQFCLLFRVPRETCGFLDSTQLCCSLLI